MPVRGADATQGGPFGQVRPSRGYSAVPSRAMGRRADVLDAESSAQLSRFQCEVLSWSFYDLGGAADAARQAQLRHVPASFASFQARGASAVDAAGGERSHSGCGGF